MFSEPELSTVRRAYAKQVTFAGGVTDRRIEAALANLRREAFLGEGPWALMRVPGGYQTTPTADPVYLYQDTLVGIDPTKGLNNGQPSFLAFLVSLGQLQEGEHAVHVGAGVGYYTAVIAELVGATGRVTAIEFEPDLARRAAANLVALPQVQVIEGDGADVAFDSADVIYVNAGAAQPAESWLDGLKDGGRLVLPLTVSAQVDGHAITRGAIFLIKRNGNDYFAHCVSGAAIYPCVGMRDPEAEASLSGAFQRGGWDKVTRLYRTADIAEDRCWVRAKGWVLAYS